MTTKLKPAQMGPVSTDTLRPEDLLASFSDTLEDLIFINGDYLSRPENFPLRDRLNALVGEAQDVWEEDGTFKDDDGAACDLINEIADVLSEYFAPPYCTFSAHPDDLAAFGFWPCMSVIDELPNVEDSDEAKELGEDCKSVNDHGNVTIYGADGSILLELV